MEDQMSSINNQGAFWDTTYITADELADRGYRPESWTELFGEPARTSNGIDEWKLLHVELTERDTVLPLIDRFERYFGALTLDPVEVKRNIRDLHSNWSDQFQAEVAEAEAAAGSPHSV